MNLLKRKREVSRIAFHRQAEALGTLLGEEIRDIPKIKISWVILESTWEAVREKDNEILEQMYEADEEIENINNEVLSTENVRSKYETLKYAVREIERLEVEERQSECKSNTSTSKAHRKLKLPKIQLRKFSGDLKEWLPFWSQFKRIHEDKTLDSDDKYNVLLQSTEPGSRARSIVESYHPSEENYVKVIDALKTRFGREDILIEVYIRDVLGLVIQNNKPNPLALVQLYDKLESYLRSLETLGVTSGKCACILCPMLESCMPEEFLRAWQRNSVSEDVKDPTRRLETLMKFMKAEVENEERISMARSGFSSRPPKVNTRLMESKPKVEEQAHSTASGLLVTQNSSLCIFCEGKHSSIDCIKAKDMSFSEKVQIVRNKQRCFLCLKSNHLAKNCRSKPKCSVCGRRHIAIFCRGAQKDKGPDNVPGCSTESTNSKHNKALANLTSETGVLLPTLVVTLRGRTPRRLRAVIDTGSQRSYILRSVADEEGLKAVRKEVIVHSLFGGQKSDNCDHQVYRIHLASLDEEYLCNFEVLDQEIICENLPFVPSNTKGLQNLREKGVGISDVGDGSGSVQLLIGADIAGKLYTGNVEMLPNGLVALGTSLGWTMMGRIPSFPIRESTAMIVTNMLTNEMRAADLWKLETIGITDPAEQKSKSEVQIEIAKKFSDTITVNSEGRYEVGLPWKEGHPPLPSYYEVAMKRLDSTLSKLRNSRHYDDYVTVFNEWIDEGVIEIVPEEQINNWGHYLPHRAVIKESSDTTKVRPVFDASVHLRNTPSLNDCLETGINLIERIPSLLHKFRMKRLGVVADIRRAFLQISIKEEDRDFLRFLWKDQDDNLIVYRHRRVVFGVVSSPFLLNATIKHHLEKIRSEWEKQENLTYSKSTLDILQNNFYVDNLISSFEDEQELDTFKEEAITVMKEGKFELRCWEYTGQKTESNTSKVLGLVWDRKKETLGVSADCIQIPLADTITKRTILSAVHKVFDPLGFTCPVTVQPKLLLRSIWKEKSGWDDEVSEEVRGKFLEWATDLPSIVEIGIPRWIAEVKGQARWSIHTFCDASESAYAAAVFLRVESDCGVKVQLIQAKNRVSPLKKVSIPRLELLAALIGVRLHASLINYFPEPCESYFWTDSATVLAWIQRGDKWTTFVCNRVAEIRQLSTREQWRHVPGIMNPADLPSRGCSGKKLLLSRWWEGPRWLRDGPDSWNFSEISYDEAAIVSEMSKSSITFINSTKTPLAKDWYYRYFSNFEKIVRMIGWIYRFIHNSRARNSDKIVEKRGPLSIEEIVDAELKVLKYIQSECFNGVRDPLISSLKPFEDFNGIIRLKTKIAYRADSYDFRFPIVLPKHHPVVELIIRRFHNKQCHVGVQGLLASLRERYWILGGRRTVKTVIARCVTCRRYDASRIEQPSPPICADRVRDAGVFEITGIDLAGPIFLQGRKKAWICLFTCGVYRAVHLELVTSLSTDDFLLALRRFVSRRGRPKTIFCDNATNFKGAENAFRHVDWNQVHEYAVTERITWKFIPPTAAWWGGWWERMIGMLKKILRKVLKRASLNYSEMETVLCDCEKILNARPLTSMSNDPEELVAITPAMFLQDVQDTGMPECDVLETTDLSRKFKYRKKLKEDLRCRFRSEYLGQLAIRAKEKGRTEIRIGDVVLIENENRKRMDWQLGRVILLLPGADGCTRLVRLKTASGEMMRPVQRLYPLLEAQEATEDNSSPSLSEEVIKPPSSS